MKFNRVILIVYIVLAGLSSCNKYPEGPKISLRTVKHRLSGDWEVTKFEVNGIDSLSTLESHKFNIGNKYYKDKPLPAQYQFCGHTTFKAENDISVNSKVYIGYDKKSLYFLTTDLSNSFINKHLVHKDISVYGQAVFESWFRILKLTHKELKLRSLQTSAIPYVIEFKKI